MFLICFSFAPIFSKTFITTTTQLSSYSPSNPCHNRLSHPFAQIVSLIVNKYNFSHLNKKSSIGCFAYCITKIHKSSFLFSTSSYIKPLELIHSNLWGPSFVPSSKGYQYCIHFVDVYS